ncbi:uncharacterized protein [Anolis sagrei]|uniref:uncharacterized protein n=1 Tax=Anolis sagrei TaxID=38937 RepID=UPI00351FA600
MPSFGGAHCCLPLHQSSWVRSLLRKKVSIEDLPEDLLLDILSLVPRNDLVFSCRRVCSRWRYLVDLPVLWKRKCRRMGFHLEGSDSGLWDWRTFYFHHIQRNLVKNPCGEEFLDFWEANQPYWEVSEDVLSGRCVQFYERCLRIPRPPQEIRRCFVFNSSDGPRSGTKRQRITLREEGYSNRLMDESRPKIIVKDWQYYSWRSGSQLHVKLLSAGLEVLQECHLLSSNSDDWWNELSHTFEGYPSGVRHIDLEHEVEARTFVKITGTSVTIDREETQKEAAATTTTTATTATTATNTAATTFTKKSRFPAVFNLCLPATSRLEAWELYRHQLASFENPARQPGSALLTKGSCITLCFLYSSTVSACLQRPANAFPPWEFPILQSASSLGQGPSPFLGSPKKPPTRRRTRQRMANVGNLPEDVLIEILIRIPARELIRNCRLVCLLWRDLVDLPSLWKRKCQRNGYRARNPDKPPPDWKIHYFLCSLERNLIKNPCAEDGFSCWRKDENGGDEWKIEALPGDHGHGFPHPHVQKYFVTSFDSCIKSQMITLKKEGYWDQLMDQVKPDIVVEDWFAARYDCGCRYQLCVQLLSADYIVLQEFRPEDVVIEQWSDAEWRQASHTFHDYPPGVRHVLFRHGGCDTQFWAGWYGVRVTNSRLSIGPEVAP